MRHPRVELTPNGAVRAAGAGGLLPRGTLQDGAGQEGALREGALREGALREGALREGRGGAVWRDEPEGVPALWRRARAAELGEAAVWVTWELLRMCAPASPAERDAFSLLVLGSFVATEAGSGFLPLEREALALVLRPLGPTEGELGALASLVEALDAQVPRFADVVGRAPSRRPLVIEGARLYHERLLRAEDRLVASVSARLRQDGEAADAAGARAAALAGLIARPPFRGGVALTLAPKQVEAVSAALSRRFAIITGGPGTGKTSVVVSMLRALARLGVDAAEIALAAPTGKAAHRLRQSVGDTLRLLATPLDPADERLLGASPAATTLHRLLGYSPSRGTFRHHENNRLPARFVIVDEASMIDLVLMERLLRAIDPGATLVLLGDADQLPSVEAGAVLRALGEAAAVRLVDSHRMDPRDPAGRAILDAARRINEGLSGALFAQGLQESPGAQEPVARGRRRAESGQGELFGGPPQPGIATRVDPGELRFSQVELLDTALGEQGPNAVRQALWRAWWARHFTAHESWRRVAQETLPLKDVGASFLQRPELVGPQGDSGVASPDQSEIALASASALVLAVLAHFESARVLCVTRGEGLSTGAEAVNAYFHGEALRHARSVGAPRSGGTLLAGEPVMLLENDYDRGLYNGDQGVVVTVAGVVGSWQGVCFARGAELCTYPLEALRSRLGLCYATTVHKSQGSEMSHVAIVLPDLDHPLVTRELLYTAVTRSRHCVIVVGSRAVLDAGVERRLVRASAIAQKLARQVASENPRIPSRA